MTLSLKVGIATGSAKRFAVGDSAVQLLDVLAGSMLGDMAAAANAARRGEVVVAASTVSALEGQLEVTESRPVSVGTGDFSVVSAVNGELTGKSMDLASFVFRKTWCVRGCCRPFLSG